LPTHLFCLGLMPVPPPPFLGAGSRSSVLLLFCLPLGGPPFSSPHLEGACLAQTRTPLPHTAHTLCTTLCTLSCLYFMLPTYLGLHHLSLLVSCFSHSSCLTSAPAASPPASYGCLLVLSCCLASYYLPHTATSLSLPTCCLLSPRLCLPAAHYSSHCCTPTAPACCTGFSPGSFTSPALLLITWLCHMLLWFTPLCHCLPLPLHAQPAYCCHACRLSSLL